ncbi:MAG: GTPase Era [Betaproteobacteria bacterium]|nr:MAG: GTPase Era [Betaproteobacteria bacterium]
MNSNPAPAPVGDFRCGQIAVIGRPNVGKSTLLNELVGAKVAITSRKAQTTRLPVRGIVTTESAQFVFVDTPGYQTKHGGEMNRRMNASVRKVLSEVDVVLWVWDAARLVEADLAGLALAEHSVNVIAVPNKVDTLLDRAAFAEKISEVAAMRSFASIVPVSATKRTQTKALMGEIEKLLPLSEPMYDADDLTDKSERFLASEIVREKVFRFTGDELPYRSAVMIEKFETEGNLRRIFAAILVDKESQRPILIGSKGETLKRIGTEARLDMQKLFGGPVYLELFVKVKSGWSESALVLRELGIT